VAKVAFITVPTVELLNFNFPYPFYFFPLSSKYPRRHELLISLNLFLPLMATHVLSYQYKMRIYYVQYLCKLFLQCALIRCEMYNFQNKIPAVRISSEFCKIMTRKSIKYFSYWCEFNHSSSFRMWNKMSVAFFRHY